MAQKVLEDISISMKTPLSLPPKDINIYAAVGFFT